MKNEELDILIEKSLKKSEDFSLPLNFAQKVTVVVVRHEQWKNDLKEYLILIGVILSLLLVAVALYCFLDKGLLTRLLAFITGNTAQVIGIAFILNFILLADRVLLPLLFNRWSSRQKV